MMSSSTSKSTSSWSIMVKICKSHCWIRCCRSCVEALRAINSRRPSPVIISLDLPGISFSLQGLKFSGNLDFIRHTVRVSERLSIDLLLHCNLLFKVLDVLMEAVLLLNDVLLFIFIGLLEVVIPHIVVPVLLVDVYLATAHWKINFLFLLQSFGNCRWSREFLKLLQPLFIFLIFFLHLVAYKTHILACPDNRQLVRSWSCPCKNVCFFEQYSWSRCSGYTLNCSNLCVLQLT